MRRCTARPWATECGSGTRELLIEVERDHTVYGEEVKFGGGKAIRDGMGQGQLGMAVAVDTVITNALILDWSGIVKADIGIKDGRIAGIGKAGSNPDVQPGAGIVIGPGTEVDRRRGVDRDRGRDHRFAHPFHLPAADRGRAHVGRDDDDRRRHGARGRDQRHDLHARPLEPRADVARGRGLADEPRFSGQGECEPAGDAQREQIPRPGPWASSSTRTGVPRRPPSTVA